MVINLANTYIILAGKWAHVTLKILIDTTDSLNKAILKRRHKVGLGANNSVINLHRPINKHGLGLRSFSDLRLTSLTRELDINLHSRENHGCTMRNSNELSTILSRTLEPKHTKTYKRFLLFNLTLLASYGYFIRDTYKLLESQILKELIKITSENLKNNSKPSLHPV